jgi:hypothetical protein
MSHPDQPTEFCSARRSSPGHQGHHAKGADQEEGGKPMRARLMAIAQARHRAHLTAVTAASLVPGGGG